MMMIAMMNITMMIIIILEPGHQSYYCLLVFVRRALGGPTVAKPQCKGRQKALPQDSA